MATTGQVDNYPGFEEGVDGFELGEKMQRGSGTLWRGDPVRRGDQGRT